jgi:hypothetical protein
VNAATRRSGAVAIVTAVASTGSTAIRASPSHTASSAPSAPPSRATTALSTSVCCTSRQRLAPTAARTLISRWRPVARASIRLATLAQAMSSTTPTMPISTSTGVPSAPRISERPREASCSTSVLAAKRSRNACEACAKRGSDTSSPALICR